MRKYICGYLKLGTEGKSSTIPHISRGEKQCSSESGIFTLCYAGNLFAGRNPELLFEALQRFKNITKNFRFILVGLEGVGLNDLIQRYGLAENVEVIGPVSYERAIEYSCGSDVLLILESCYAEGIYFPSKFVDYVQTGRPILSISPKEGTLRDIHREYGGGIAVDCSSIDEIFDGIMKLYVCWHEGGLDEAYGSAKLAGLFDRHAVMKLYAPLLSRLTGKQ
jgi:glycosyltransferase involved in cell wall biosynthesis